MRVNNIAHIFEDFALVERQYVLVLARCIELEPLRLLGLHNGVIEELDHYKPAMQLFESTKLQ